MRKSKRILAALSLVVLLSTALGACGGSSTGQTPAASTGSGSTNEGAQSNSITVGIAQDLDDSLDPHRMVAAGTKEVMFNVFEGLVKPNANGELIPAVAADYSLSEDRRTYTFALREGVKFHNGATVTAADVVYSIERCADASEGTPLVPALSVVQSVEAVNEKTVTVTIDSPNNEFLAYLTLAIIPQGYEEQDTAPVGTGPFRFVSRSAQQDIVLERFADYWGTPALLDGVTFQIVENADALVFSLLAGTIDLCAHLTASQAAQLEEQFTILEGTMNLVQALYLNNASAPFDNVLVRQALAHAVDIQQVLDLTANGHGTPVGSSMYPAFTKYYDETLAGHYGYDPEKAKSLLAQAGYPDGFAFTITVPSNYQPHIDTAQVLVEQFRAVGVTATIQPVEWSVWLSDVYAGRSFQSTVVGVDASTMTARAMLERFTSTAGDNFINYSNPDYDKAFNAAQAAVTDADQIAAYKQAQGILTETAANVYLQDMADLVAMNPALDGLQFYPIYVLDLSTVHYVD